MATKKTTTTRTTTATATKKGTNKMKDIKTNVVLDLTPYTNPKTNKGFILPPHAPKTYINAEGQIKIEYESILVNETLQIKRYTKDPVISNNYQTFWTDPDNNLYQINITPSIVKDDKTYSPITFFLKDLLSQLGCPSDIQSYTPEQITYLFKYIKSLNTSFQFITTELTSKAGNHYTVLKPIKGTVIPDTDPLNYSL